MKTAKFFRRFRDIILLAAAFVLWFVSAPIVRAIEPTAAVFDAAVLMAFVYAIAGTLVFLQFAWLMLRLLFPAIYNFLDTKVSNTFKVLTLWQQLRTALFLLLSLLAIQALLVVALL
jgi:hypothetical protein